MSHRLWWRARRHENSLISKHERTYGFYIRDVDEFSTQMENTPYMKIRKGI
jgi:hypothetical protein